MKRSSAGGFTLPEILIAVGILAILAGVLIPNLIGARRSTQVKVIDAYLAQCLTAAEARRSVLTGTVWLPASCAALAPAPDTVTSEIALSGGQFTVNVSGPAGNGTHVATAVIAQTRQ